MSSKWIIAGTSVWSLLISQAFGITSIYEFEVNTVNSEKATMDLLSSTIANNDQPSYSSDYDDG